jgi:hypothetical protein
MFGSLGPKEGPVSRYGSQEGCFLIFCPRVPMSPVSGASEGLPVGDSYLGKYYRILVASMVFANKDEDRGVFNWQLTVLSWRKAMHAGTQSRAAKSRVSSVGGRAQALLLFEETPPMAHSGVR